MPADRRTKAPFAAIQASIGLGMVGCTAAFAQQSGPATTEGPVKEWASTTFNNSEITSTGWALPLATLDDRTTVRTELSYADLMPGLYLNRKFSDGAGQADLGFMNFSLNAFPPGDTLSFNSKGDLYSNGNETGKQLGLRYSNKIDLDQTSSFEGVAFAGASVRNGAPSAGITGNYRTMAGNWHLLAGTGIAWLGERDTVALNAIGTAQRDFSYATLPDGRLTLGLELRDQLGKSSSATAFGEYQTHLTKQDGPSWLHHVSGLFGLYAGTQSYGGKAGVLYSPKGVGGANKDFGVSFGPTVGWDSREHGPQVNLELRAGF